jgi:hypothetical protein
MQIEARFRRRAVVGEIISELNDEFLSQLSKVKGLWLESKSVEDVFFDAGTGESAASDLSPCLTAGIKGAISYASRLPAAIADKAISDDSIVLKFDDDEVNFEWFCNDVFPEVIKVFLPYRAAIVTDLDQDLDDFEDIVQESQRTGSDIDGRDSVFRIHPANYFDDLMCKRAFGLSANEVVEKLKTSVERAENFETGALLIISSNPLVGEQLFSMDSLVRKDLSKTA